MNKPVLSSCTAVSKVHVISESETNKLENQQKQP